jgi:hypothetical protein
MKKGLLLVAALALAATASAQNLNWYAQTTDLSDLATLGSMQMHGTATVTVGANKFAYTVGGNTSVAATDVRKIHYAPITGRQIGAWAEATQELTDAAGGLGTGSAGIGMCYHTRSTFGYNGRLYVVGGRANVGDATNRWDGVRVYTPDATGNIPAGAATYYTGLADVTNSIAAVTPIMTRLEMTTVTRASVASPGNQVVYVVGGGSAAEATNQVQKFYISGTTGEIINAGPATAAGRALGNAVTSAVGTLDANRNATSAVIVGNNLYVIGGGASNPLVQRATIGVDDNLSAFSAIGVAALPEGRTDGGAAVLGGTIYVTGGCVTGNTDIRNVVYYATPDSVTGDIASWSTGNPIPVTHPTDAPGLRRVGSFVVDDMLVIVGGRIANTNAPLFSDAVFVGLNNSETAGWMHY